MSQRIVYYTNIEKLVRTQQALPCKCTNVFFQHLWNLHDFLFTSSIATDHFNLSIYQLFGFSSKQFLSNNSWEVNQFQYEP